jgi:signal transduction histidine kinase
LSWKAHLGNVCERAPGRVFRETRATEVESQLPPPERVVQVVHIVSRARTVRGVAGILALALAYYGAAKLGQTLRYTASVAAIWPPAGLGIAALYLWGLRWWPGIFVGEVLVNAELLAHDEGLPFWSVVGQQTGNMLEIVVGAIVLRRLIGPRAALDRMDHVFGMLIALLTATTISATAGTVSMVATGVVDASHAPTFFRTWLLGDTIGGLVVLPLALTWIHDPVGSWRRVRTWEGALLVTTVAGLGIVAVSADEPLTYMVFPALIWASLRFGPPGVTLSIAIAAGAAIGFTANEVGPFAQQPIDHRTLSTQVYIAVAALTSLLLGALASERERSVRQLDEARRQASEWALEERHRIARELHDSVSQALFSTGLQVRTAERALDRDGVSRSSTLGRSLAAIADLTRGAQREMRALLFELKGSVEQRGLLPRLVRHASDLSVPDGLVIDFQGAHGRLPLSSETESHLFRIGREALANVVRHSQADRAWVRVESGPSGVSLEVGDDGDGFDTGADRPGHYGLESMRSRAAEVGATLTIRSEPGLGTVVLVDAPVSQERAPDDA